MATKNNVPGTILAAAAGMLAPFGVDLFEILNSNSGTEKPAGARYLSMADIEAKYGVKRWTLHRLIKAGKIAAAKLSASKAGKVLVDVDSIEQFLRSSKINKGGQA